MQQGEEGRLREGRSGVDRREVDRGRVLLECGDKWWEAKISDI